MSVPLEQKLITVYNERTKHNEDFPALHPRWMKPIRFIIYQSPPLDHDDRASIEEWKERAGFIRRDLQWLLQLPHDKFWCQVIFDESLHRCIDSYLKHAPRSHDVVFDLPSDVQVIQRDIHRFVYIVCVRMATYKESKDHHITPQEFGKIIYENYIFDIPKLMDLSVLYGASTHDDLGNKPLLTKMITNIFTQQPNYEDDLKAVVPTILQVLQNICVTCGVNATTPTQSPLKLDDPKLPNLISMATTQFQDVVFYISDTAQTLCTFLDVYPPATKAFMQEDFVIKLAALYEGLFPAIASALRERDWSSDSYRQMLTSKVHRSQLSILKIFRQILSHNCLMPLLDDIGLEEAESHVEDYLHCMTGVLHERRFLCHLEHLCPYREDRDLLLQSNYPVDETRLQFILDAIHEAIAIYGHKSECYDDKLKSPVTGGESGATDYGGADYEVADTDEVAGACAARRHVTPVEIDSLISSVKDLLPDLGDGFIELCLEETDFDAERVINMLLEDNIPTSLSLYDRYMPRQLKADPIEEPPSVLSERRNIYDDDEFDVFSRDSVDTSRIHKGKRDNFKGNAARLLDDKTSVAALKPLYDKYGHEDVESVYDTPLGGYDDEYDDTYDEHTIGATDADNLDELTNKKIVIVPRVLGAPAPRESESEEEDEAKKRDQFVEDPSKIRERQEQRRQTKEYNRRGQGQHRGQGQRPNPGAGHAAEQGQGQGEGQGRRTYDVKGAAKGQGQSAQVLRNRAWKEKNKSANRKNLADKKRKI